MPSARMVLGTGALDLWVADVQDVFPAIMDVARCYKTVVVTYQRFRPFARAEHYGLTMKIPIWTKPTLWRKNRDQSH